MPRNDAILLDMLIASRRVIEFIGNQDRSAFQTDRKTQSAVLHQLLLIGEAAKRLSGDFRAQHPRIPWKAITGLRDRLIHAYDRVDLTVVWDTCREDIPKLIAFLDSVAPSPPDAEP